MTGQIMSSHTASSPILPATPAPALFSGIHRPEVHRITFADLAGALRLGSADFTASPSHLLFLGLIYPIIGLVMAKAAMGEALLPLVFPLAAGFALVGPIAAVAFYDVSRRREHDADASWLGTLDLLHRRSLGAIGAIGMLLVAIFVAWLGTAQWLYGLTLGPAAPATVGAFAHDVLATPAGWALIVCGNLAGAAFAAVAFTVSVVSLPLLLDQDVGFATAVATSARCVRANPVVLPAWGAIVGSLLLLGSLTLFVGLAIVLPVLGHASWHLYRKLIGAAPTV